MSSLAPLLSSFARAFQGVKEGGELVDGGRRGPADASDACPLSHTVHPMATETGSRQQDKETHEAMIEFPGLLSKPSNLHGAGRCKAGFLFAFQGTSDHRWVIGPA